MINTKLKLELNFLENSIDGEVLYEIASKHLGFVPKYGQIESNQFEVDSDFDYEIIKQISTEYFSLQESKEIYSPCFVNSTPALKNPPQIIYWVNDIQNLPDEIFLLKLMSNDGFVAGYCYEEEYVYLQSSERLSDLLLRKKDITYVKTYYNEFWAEELIDISKNAGRRKVVSGMSLISCWRMWFGKNSFKLLDREKLMTFNNAREIKIFNNDIVFIELYNNPFDINPAEKELLQKHFREHMEMDILEKN